MITEMLFDFLADVFMKGIDLIPALDMNIDLTPLIKIKEAFTYINLFISVPLIISMIGFIVLRDNSVFFKNIVFAVLRKIPFFK